jgi:elongation factor P--(R)-beta-lysine ligase
MTPETATSRARIIRTIRDFFASRNILEVETPMLTHGSPTDCHIDPFAAQFHPNGWRESAGSETAYLHTSPEFAMKRLLAQGFGDIYQICKVFRNGETGSMHNPEFTMLEWYRRGGCMNDLISEVLALIRLALGDRPWHERPYVELFAASTGIDPLSGSIDDLTGFCRSRGLNPPPFATVTDGLQFVMSEFIEPRFDPEAITVVSRYPADQAVFASLSPGDPAVALRFEAYFGRIELANGFEELGDWKENERRMEQENEKRRAIGKPELPIDRRFIEALQKGLPPCSGVALGLDRLIMCALSKKTIGEVVAFPWETA